MIIKYPRLRKLLTILLVITCVIVILPYLIPLSDDTVLELREMPYENSQMTTVNGTFIHYRTYEGKGEPKGKLLMIHGLGGSTYSYEASVKGLTLAGYHVMLVDLPGFGYSQRNPKYDHSQKNRARDLWQLIKKIEEEDGRFGTDKFNWTLVGHSMGGGTAAAMASENPKETERVILVDGAVFDDGRNGNLFQIPFIKRYLQLALEYLVINEGRITSFLTSAYGQEPSSEQIEGYLKPLLLKGTAKSAGTLLKTSKNLQEEELKAIQPEIIGIWGAEDSWVSVDQAYGLKELLPDMKLYIIEGAGHCPMETHTEAFNQIMLEILSEY